MAERNWQRQYRLSKRLWHYQSIRLDHDDARALRELAKIALQALLELPLGLFRRRYLAVPDHGLGELHRSGGIDVFAMHGVAMGEAAAAGVLDASTPARGGPAVSAQLDFPIIDLEPDQIRCDRKRLEQHGELVL